MSRVTDSRRLRGAKHREPFDWALCRSRYNTRGKRRAGVCVKLARRSVITYCYRTSLHWPRTPTSPPSVRCQPWSRPCLSMTSSVHQAGSTLNSKNVIE